MRIKFEGESITLIREADDPKFYGARFAKGEHNLLSFLKKALNALGFDLIKKRAQKDGHMIGDEYQPYLRARQARHPKANLPHIYIWWGSYALRGANEDWNNGEVTLLLETDVFEKGQDTLGVIRQLVAGKSNVEFVEVTHA